KPRATASAKCRRCILCNAVRGGSQETRASLNDKSVPLAVCPANGASANAECNDCEATDKGDDRCGEIRVVDERNDEQRRTEQNIEKAHRPRDLRRGNRDDGED